MTDSLSHTVPGVHIGELARATRDRHVVPTIAEHYLGDRSIDRELSQNYATKMLEMFYLTHLSPQMQVFTMQLLTKRALEDAEISS